VSLDRLSRQGRSGHAQLFYSRFSFRAVRILAGMFNTRQFVG
jgi:hypothetical protein